MTFSAGKTPSAGIGKSARIANDESGPSPRSDRADPARRRHGAASGNRGVRRGDPGCVLTLNDVQLSTYTTPVSLAGGGGAQSINVPTTGGAGLPICVQGKQILVPVTLSGSAS